MEDLSAAIVREWLVPCAWIFLILGIEDLFIDWIYWSRNWRYRNFTTDEFQQLNEMPEKKIAIIIGAWHEGDIILNMIAGNMERIKYQNVHIFIGIYPNDFHTMLEVKKLETLYPQVHGVVNSQNGPTSKGQMLNEVISAIMQFEKDHKCEFMALHMQDAEDIIHPYILKIGNFYLDQYEFIQTPVFSLPVGGHEMVAGTYLDEFTLAHYKDMSARVILQVAIPSAGVGTTIARSCFLQLMQQNPEGVFQTKSVTEDYLLGHQVHQLGARSTFAAVDLGNILGMDSPDRYIATREYFPKKFLRSLRQKTRWNLGIIIQGTKTLGWYGNWRDRYFLYRDRKGAVTALLGVWGLVLIFAINYHLLKTDLALVSLPGKLKVLLVINLGLMLYFVFQRARCIYYVYGWSHLWLLPLRWPLGMIINALAVANAFKRGIWASWRKKDVAWGKTQHELPKHFGVIRAQDVN